MVNPRCELHLGRLERVVCGELNGQEENTLGVRRVALKLRLSVSQRIQAGNAQPKKK